MRKLIQIGQRLPRGYRTAYYDPFRHQMVTYPVGIHLLARIVRRIWERSFYYKLSRFEQELRAAYHQGRIDEQESNRGYSRNADNPGGSG